MKPRERRDSGQNDLFKARLDQIIDMSHPRVRLAHAIDWWFLEGEFGAVYTDGKGGPPLTTRLMAGLHILKYSENLSDERLCEVWAENPYFQYFCGEEFFQHKLVFDRSSLTRWRQRMGEERLNALIQESLAVAAKTNALKPSELTAVVVDTTVQPKNVAYPTDAKLLNRARERLVRLTKKARRRFAPNLCQGGQVRAHQAPALRPRQTVQARQEVLENAQDLSRPSHA
jgi:IS5 family transposase